MDDGVRPSCFSSSAAFGWGCGATGAELLPLLRARTSRKLTRPAAHSSSELGAAATEAGVPISDGSLAQPMQARLIASFNGVPPPSVAGEEYVCSS